MARLSDKLTGEQRKVLNAIRSGAQRAGASPKELKAAIETGLVESNLTNPSAMTDHDSQGWRQERASLYPDPTNLPASVDRFFKETKAVRDKYGTAGALAAAVQRPRADLRGKYQDRSADAQGLLGGSVSSDAASPVAAPTEASTVTPDPVTQVTTQPLVPQVQPTGAAEFGFSAKQDLALPQGYTQPQSTWAPPDLSTTEVAPTAPDATTGAESGAGAAAPASSGATLVVGDSLGVGTAPFLEKQLGNVTADVKVGRPSSNGVPILSRELSSGNYQNVVLDLGTNDSGPQQLRRSIAQAKKAAGRGVNIFIPTVNGPGAQAKNKIIQEAAGGNVHVVDWAGKSSGLGADGIHATSRGYQSRAKLIAAAISGGQDTSLGSRVTARGNVKVNPGADRAGVPTNPGILKLAREVAAQAGRTLTVGTGTNHSQMTTSGNVSDHWSGNAVDIPDSGESLTKLGQDALIAFGMDPKKARSQKGGVYNLPYGKGRRIQVLFNTTVGGNHYNHLHVGVTGNG